MTELLELRAKGCTLALFGVRESEEGLFAEAYIGQARKGRVFKHEGHKYRLTQGTKPLGYLEKSLTEPLFLERI